MAYDRIPAELQACPQWVTWAYVKLDDRITKQPYDAKTGKLASVSNADTWSDFQTAVTAANASNGRLGIGFVFTANDPYAGIDIDRANASVKMEEDQDYVYSAFKSYTERSPSGNGFHIIVKTQTIVEGKRKAGVELYCKGRYFTFTGDVVRDLEIIDYTDRVVQLAGLLNEKDSNKPLPSLDDVNRPETAGDEEIKARVCRDTDRGRLNARLIAGDKTAIKGTDNSGSALDQAIVNAIVYETQNVEQVERLWRSTYHAQQRLIKMARRDYRFRTIRRGFDLVLKPVEVDPNLQATWGTSSVATHAGVANADGGDHALLQSPITSQPQMTQHHVAAPKPGVNPYTFPPGLMGDIATYVYQSAPRQVEEIALAAAIGWMAGFASRAYNISGTGLNLYLAMLASSGTGKEAMSEGYMALLDGLADMPRPILSAALHVGPSDFSSPQALLKYLVRTKSAVSIIGEFGNWLSRMTGIKPEPTRAALKSILMEIYNKSGRKGVYRQTVYSDTTNNINEIRAPNLTLLGESTPSTFYACIDDATIIDGFLPRFIIIEYSGPIQYRNKTAASIQPSPQLLSGLHEFVTIVGRLNGPSEGSTLLSGEGPYDVPCDAEATERLDALSILYTDTSNKGKTEGVKNIWSRVWVNVAKLAALVAVGVNPGRPLVTLANVEWANTLVLHSVSKIISKISTGEIAGTLETEQYARVITMLRELPNLPDDVLEGYGMNVKMRNNRYVAHSWFSRQLTNVSCFKRDAAVGGPSKAIARVQQRLIAEGILIPIEAKTHPALRAEYDMHGTCFLVTNRVLT